MAAEMACGAITSSFEEGHWESEEVSVWTERIRKRVEVLDNGHKRAAGSAGEVNAH